MKIRTEHLLFIPPKEGNPRNSEGDFIRLPDGKILFVYSQFEGNSWDDQEDSKIVGIYSDDEYHFNLDSKRIIIDPKRFGGENAMCSTLRKTKDGIRIYFGIKFDTHDMTKAPVRNEYYFIDSKDGYDFSSDPVLCFPKNDKGYYCVNNSRVETMSNGRIFMPMSDHGFHFDGEKYVFNSRGISKFLYSDDGITFNEDVQALEFPDINDKNGLQEPGIIELPNGTLYGYFRTDADYQYESFSYDNGITWTQVQPSKFESPLSPMSITKNPYSNKYYAIYNPFKDRPESIEHPRFRNTWGRTPLAIAESDDGINFSDFALIESDLKCGYCYPAIFYLSDKEALISYCSGGGDITTLQRTTISKIYFE